MTSPTLLRAAGTALYGPRFRRDMARAISRTEQQVSRYLDGTTPVPASVWAVLRALLAERRIEIRELERRLAA